MANVGKYTSPVDPMDLSKGDLALGFFGGFEGHFRWESLLSIFVDFSSECSGVFWGNAPWKMNGWNWNPKSWRFGR